MRKLILSLVFVLATGTVMNANSTNEEVLPSSKEAIEIVEGDCLQEAWDFGTVDDMEDGESRDFVEWWLTNWYYENFCE
jgi:hypothetical protein